MAQRCQNKLRGLADLCTLCTAPLARIHSLILCELFTSYVSLPTEVRVRIGICSRAMESAPLWQKAATCLRLAQTLSVSNPGRLALLEMAEGFERRAKELEAASMLRPQAQTDLKQLWPQRR